MGEIVVFAWLVVFAGLVVFARLVDLRSAFVVNGKPQKI